MYIQVRLNQITQAGEEPDYLNIDQGRFSGDLYKAEKALQSFIDNNTVIYKSYKYDYGVLTINGKKHNTYPGGIDIDTMFKYCGLNKMHLDLETEQIIEAPNRPRSLITEEANNTSFLMDIMMHPATGILSAAILLSGVVLLGLLATSPIAIGLSVAGLVIGAGFFAGHVAAQCTQPDVFQNNEGISLQPV